MTRNLSVPTKVSSLALAVALAAGPSPAAAQSFQGTPAVTSGSASVNEGAGTTTVTVDTSQTVIDWDADDDAVGNFGAINFQPSGTTATFQNNGDLVGDFAVLNRLDIADQTRIVALNGTINSLVNGQTGGSIYFYSPSGFVITGTAVINVGSLVLSASPITVDGQGNFINNGTVTFGQAPNPGAAINTVSDINGTAQINSNGSGSYVALVAPRIQHQGDIRTDGTVALVAAEAATINFSPDGLFNIAVTVGTDDSNGIVVDGGTIGRNSAVEGVNDHRAYLVAVAKNDAVTMVINNGGSVGFDTATSASVENNVVVLSGGYDIQSGDHWTTSGVSNVATTITNATFSSDVDAQVTGGAAIDSSAGALSFGGDLSIISGETTTTGGNALVDALNGNALTIAGDLYVRAFRRNADGSQTGLISRLGAQNGSTVTIGGDVTLDSDSFGAAAADFGENGTNATGGNAQINIGANSTLNVTGSVTVHADGYGGQNFFGGGAGGAGTGGDALVMAINGGATVDIGGTVTVSAQGFGGSAGECSICDVTGGNGTGGNASVHTNVGAPNMMTLGSDVTITAAGWGGAGDAQAGTGRGGLANLGASDGSSLTVAADTEVDASGFGGYGFDNVGGLGRGGEAHIGVNAGGSIELTGPAFVTANGQGGDGLNGGTGTGGVANIGAILGTVHALGDVLVSANSDGGFANFATGTGGAGLADNETIITPAMTEASLFSSGGTLIVDGLTTVAANATGGDGGFNGGDGGDAVAAGIAGTIDGGAVIHAANSDNGPSVIQLGTVVVTADAQGGQGSDGSGGTNGSDGGNGGSATGGKAVVTAAAGSGDVTAGATLLSATATGGDGGDGGGGDGGDGGNAGNGGNATGGFINVGTESGNVNFAQGANNGTATYTTIVALTTATGGNGGNGGFGNILGLAGDGGDAIGGNSVLLVRGSQVTVGNVNLDASAFGGDGGLDPNESFQGDGGDAVTGVVGVLVTNRFQLIGQQGTLNAGAITGTATATGGNGAVDGGQWTQGGSTFEVLNSSATIDSVNLAIVADGADPNAAETFATTVAVVNGTVDINGGFAISTPDRVSVHVNDASPLTQAFTAGSFSVSAANFVHDETRPPPAQVGVIGADTFNLTTGQDLIVDAHLISTGPLSLVAPGLIDIEDATSGVSLSLNAGTTIAGGTMTSGGTIDAFAPGDITLGMVNAGSDINIMSLGGSLSLGNLSSPSIIDLEAGGDIGFGDVTADDLDFDAGGDVIGGDIIAGTVASGEAGGAVTLGDINVGILQSGGVSDDGFAVGIGAAGSISVGDVVADEAIGFATFGDLVTGGLNAGTDVMTLIGGNATIASITTPNSGRTYHGDAQMFIDAGGPDNFDPILLFGATPVRSGGSYNVTGPISTGSLQVAAASISTGAITAPIGIYLDALGNISTGPLSSAGGIEGFSDGSILTGDIDSSGAGLLLVADANITTGAISVATDASIDALGNIILGAATVGGGLSVDAGGNLTTGTVTAPAIDAEAGGLATLDGMWQSASIELWSDDIEIAANGGIDAGVEGNIRLVSTNATQALIGDGLTGTGYQLSNAEFGRLSAGNVQIAARGDASAAIDMLIGALDVTGPTAGSTIEDPFGALVFATGDPETLAASGVIRIVGDLTATGFADTNAIEFYTGRFELDAATGLLEITGSGTDLSGELYIEADRIHVADGAILDQLAANPQYAGYQDDLNAPAQVQRPDGVIRAGGIDVFPTEAVLVQNTGSAVTPAGFLTFGDGPLFSQGEPPTGPIELIINGQLITEGGLLTGVEVRDFLIDDTNIGLFTANSTINGCLLTGTCEAGGGEGPFPPGFTPTPGIQDEISLVDDGLLPPPEFGNEDLIDDNDEETDEGATSPIEPPSPLFDTSALGGKGDVDDPVSGSGNPALMGEPAGPPSTEEKQQ